MLEFDATTEADQNLIVACTPKAWVRLKKQLP
jgi:hypothetical protein